MRFVAFVTGNLHLVGYRIWSLTWDFKDWLYRNDLIGLRTLIISYVATKFVFILLLAIEGFQVLNNLNSRVLDNSIICLLLLQE